MTRAIAGTWSVGWDGKPKHDPSLLAESEWAHDHRSAWSPVSGSGASPAASPSTAAGGEGEEGGERRSAEARAEAHRVYFFLGARRAVPATISLTLSATPPSDASTSTTTPADPVVVWEVRPQPAPPLQPTSEGEAEVEDGGKGPLHTRWATRRLSSLHREIAEEARRNCEGIALQMALGEKEFIERNFGVGEGAATRGRRAASGAAAGLLVRPAGHGEVPLSPHSPLSPGESRLSDKLRGLKLQTGGAGEDEVAVPLCKGQRERLATTSSTSPSAAVTAKQAPAPTPQPAGMSSISAILAGPGPGDSTAMRGCGADVSEEQEEEGTDGLFALPLSPRSPEMAKSPFSFAAEDTKRYLSAQRVS